MSTLYVRFRAESLACNGEFYMHLPPKDVPFFFKENPHYQRPAKTLILLHGYSGDSTDWLYNSAAADYSLKYNLAVVMPSGGVSFYVDKKATGHQYCKYIGEDLIKYLRDTFGLAQNREDTFIGGLSMGGFGALHTGLMYPETFGGVIALSSALIIDGLKNMKPGMADPVMANYEYYVDTSGISAKQQRAITILKCSSSAMLKTALRIQGSTWPVERKTSFMNRTGKCVTSSRRKKPIFFMKKDPVFMTGISGRLTLITESNIY